MRETDAQFKIKNLEVNNGKTSFPINPIKKGTRRQHGEENTLRDLIFPEFKGLEKRSDPFKSSLLFIVE
jgi:hypothetical protein